MHRPNLHGGLRLLRARPEVVDTPVVPHPQDHIDPHRTKGVDIGLLDHPLPAAVGVMDAGHTDGSLRTTRKYCKLGVTQIYLSHIVARTCYL